MNVYRSQYCGLVSLWDSSSSMVQLPQVIASREFHFHPNQTIHSRTPYYHRLTRPYSSRNGCGDVGETDITHGLDVQLPDYGSN
jgi:hypothetical protein